MAKLIIISKLPGIEESTLSHKLSQKKEWCLLVKDTIDRAVKNKLTSNSSIGNEVLLAVCKENLQNNVSVVIDTMVTMDSYKDQIINVGIEAEAKIFFIICTISDENKWQSKIANTPVVLDDSKPITWEEVVKIRNLYSKWEKPHLELDMLKSEDENFNNILSFIGE